MFEDPERGAVIGAVTVDGIADPDPGTRYSGPVQVFELELGGERQVSSEGLDLMQRLATVTTGSSESMRWAAAQSAVWTLFEADLLGADRASRDARRRVRRACRVGWHE